MDQRKILELFNKHMRIEVSYPGSRMEQTDSVVRELPLSNERGFILFSRMNESTADATIEEQITYFNNLKLPFEWKVYDYDQPLDLKERLRSRGFDIEESEALMIMDLADGNQLRKIPLKPEIRRIKDEQGIWDMIKLEDEVWGVSHQSLGKRLVRDLHDDPANFLAYAAYVDGKAVSAAWMYLHEGTPFASLWGGSTLADFRKKGFYSSLLGIRAREAAARGYQLLMVDASSMSQPILEKHGFHCLARSTPCLSPRI